MLKDPEWLTVFWRIPGADDFSGQFFAPGKGEPGSGDQHLPDQCRADRVLFCLQCRRQIRYLPEKTPETLFTVAASGPIPAPEAAAAAPPAAAAQPVHQPFPLQVNANIETRFNDDSAGGTAVDPSHTENVRLNYRLQKSNFNLELQSRASYSNLLGQRPDRL